MTNLPGNPFESSAQDDPRNMGGTTANALLALAYEQRTASLIALAQLTINVDGPTASLDEDLAIIFNRLGGGEERG